MSPLSIWPFFVYVFFLCLFSVYIIDLYMFPLSVYLFSVSFFHKIDVILARKIYLPIMSSLIYIPTCKYIPIA